MKKIPIPGQDKPMVIEHLVPDMNGTLVFDGELVDGVPERLVELSESFRMPWTCCVFQHELWQHY